MTNFGPSGLLTLPSEDLRRGTVASFRVSADGALELLDPQAAQLGVGAADIALGGDGQFLYALNSVEGTVSGFEIGDDGSLTPINSVGELPTNPLSPLPIPMGLAARDRG